HAFEAPLTRLTAWPSIRGRVLSGPESVRDSTHSATVAPGTFILDAAANNAFAAVNALLAVDVPVARGRTRPPPDAPGWTRGAFVVAARTPEQAAAFEAAIEPRGVTASRVTRAMHVSLPAIRPAR